MDKEYLLHERPLKALFFFACPMIIGNLFQQFYTMIDSVVVGRYVSEQALAAIGASYSFTNVFICVAIGGGIGASVITSRYFGAREYTRMKRSIFTALLSFLVVSVILACLGLLFGRQIMSALKTPDEILDMASTYLNIYFYGLPFLFMYNVLSSMFNALGRSRIPLYLLMFSSILNIILDIYSVRTLHMGIAGVAWATVIAQGISVVLSFFLLLRELRSYEGKQTTVFSKNDLKQMTHVALPSILQQSTVSIGMMLVQSVVNSFGTEALAGFSAAMRVESLCIVPMSALGNALSSYTAQNLGSGKTERIKKGLQSALLLVAVFALIICVIIECFKKPIVLAFLGSEGTATALQTGIGYLTFMGWFFALIGLKMSVDGILRGAADMKMFTIANLANLTLRVFVAAVFAPQFGIQMVWYAVPIGWSVNFIISFAEYRSGRYKLLANRTA